MKNPSKVIEFPLTSNYKVDVIVTKKRMKNIRLTISKSGKVAVSMPNHATYAFAYEFLVRKRAWIAAQLNRINTNKAKDSCHFVNGGNILVLGKSFPLSLVQGAKNKVVFTCCTSDTNNQEPASSPTHGFTITTKDLNEEYVREIFIKWCKKYFLDLFSNRLNFIYHQIFKSNPPPTLKIKTMKSMWGNCNFVKRVVSLSIYLAKARIECIDYVITHELCHLIHHNHSKKFHDLMTTLMPDWKARKKMLSSYSLKF